MIPNDINDICELFDCQVMTDLAPKGFGDGQNNLQPVYYLGTPTELSAGLYGSVISKHFFTLKALEKYCRSAKGREEINSNMAKICPDWDEQKQEWKSEAKP